ncbi:uncharacterized protein LOC141676681 isoform X2 [Apium graveolens]|uniref:uncharacterized protein LOC141676681 isoform X1 n=1 Tax=Apium graveolens TaxID=4045 RepID=UPI003D79FAF8
MEFFNKKAIRLKSHLNKYLVACDDQESVRQSRNGFSPKATWLVYPANEAGDLIRLKSCYGKYLSASNSAFLFGMTGNKVVQKHPESNVDFSVDWEPERDGFHVKLKGFGGGYLRGNGGTPPWRNGVTHDSPFAGGSTKNWILWSVEEVEIAGESFSKLSSGDFSSLEDGGSPVSIFSASSSPDFYSKKASLSLPPLENTTSTSYSAMDIFQNAQAVRLRSHHEKYLTADDDEESVSQDRNGSSKAAKWTVEFVPDHANSFIRLKSCYNKYLTASNQPFLLGMTGRKVLQTLPRRLDSSVEWEPVRDGTNQVKLRTRYGQFLRANGGLPPWRNSVTHDVPHRTATQDWIYWHVDVVEIVVRSPTVNPAPEKLVYCDDSFASADSSSHSVDREAFSRQESIDSDVELVKREDGRTIYYNVANEFGEIDEELEGFSILFKGNSVEELTRSLEEVTGLNDAIVCSRSPLNGKLYPLRLQLPPNNVTMNVVVLPASSKVAKEFS